MYNVCEQPHVFFSCYIMGGYSDSMNDQHMCVFPLLHPSLLQIGVIFPEIVKGSVCRNVVLFDGKRIVNDWILCIVILWLTCIMYTATNTAWPHIYQPIF